MNAITDMFKSKPATDATPAAYVTQVMWDANQLEVKALRNRLASLNDLCIDNENRLAKLDAKLMQHSTAIVDAVNELRLRIEACIAGTAQLIGRVDDVSALARRIGNEIDQLQALATAQRIEAVDALSGRIEALALELGVTDTKLEQFRLDTQQAVERLRAGDSERINVEQCVQMIDALRFDMGNLADAVGERHGELAGGVADLAGVMTEMNLRIDELGHQVGGLPTIAADIRADVGEMKQAITTIMEGAEPLAKLPTLAEIMAKAGAPSVEDIQRMQAESVARGNGGATEER